MVVRDEAGIGSEKSIEAADRIICTWSSRRVIRALWEEGAFEVSVGCAEGRGRSRVLSVVAAEKQAGAAEGTKVDCELRIALM